MVEVCPVDVGVDDCLVVAVTYVNSKSRSFPHCLAEALADQTCVRVDIQAEWRC